MTVSRPNQGFGWAHGRDGLDAGGARVSRAGPSVPRNGHFRQLKAATTQQENGIWRSKRLSPACSKVNDQEFAGLQALKAEDAAQSRMKV